MEAYMSELIIEINDQNFQQQVLSNPLPVLVDFWAPWCGPCKMVAPLLDKLAEEYAGKMLVAKVNTDEDSEWAMKYGVQGIPTMLLIYDGKIINRQVGALPEPMLREIISDFLDIVKDHEVSG